MLKKLSELEYEDIVKVCGVVYSVHRTWKEGELYKIGLIGVFGDKPCILTFHDDMFVKVKKGDIRQ